MKEEEVKTKEIIEREAKALLGFVERVSEEGAMPEELAILPDIARLLSELAIVVR